MGDIRGEERVIGGAAEGTLREALLVSLEVEDEEEGFEGDEGHHEELKEDVIEGVVEALNMNLDVPDALGQGDD